MQRFFCDWCGVEQLNLTALQLWDLALLYHENRVGHVAFELCDACSTAAGLQAAREPCRETSILSIAILNNLLDPLRVRAKSPQAAAVTTEN